MSRLTDLLKRTKDMDAALGRELEQEFKALSDRRAFGLNFERHKPEMIELPSRAIRQGDKVRVLPPRGSTKKPDNKIWIVQKIEKAEDKAHLTHQTNDGVEEKKVSLDNVRVIADIHDPIYPGLVSTGKVERGGDKPFHTVINGENFHALQALTFTHRHKVDAIYIDPPYNKPDRKDWKYNNNYVDSDDAYRHSKWLAMMERRLLVAKQLLNPEKSVLIVTIDEKEYLRLGLLLEQTFPEQNIQMINSSINLKGVARGKEFYRVDEYIFFVYLGGAEVIDANVSGLCISATELGEDVSSSPRKSKKVRWGYLRRSGSDAQREDAENQFYPILVDSLTKKIVKADKAIELGKDKNDYTPPDGLEAIWPIRDDKSEGRWQLSFDSVNKYLEYGYVKLGAASQANSYTLLYLPEGAKQDFENGKIHQIGKDNFGGLLLEYVDSSLKAARPKTQWNSKSHSATDYGSSLILKFIPKRKFTNPKSLYAVEDTLRFFVANNPDAIILDFFAGSGTTAHAVMRLNRQDGGRCWR